MGSDDGSLRADDAFGLLGDNLRLSILRALWSTSAAGLPFSALRERVGNPDSGRFNYHLNELRGHFVTDGEDGYRLTQAGREVARAVAAGSITSRPEMGPAPISAQCDECGGDLVFRYDEYGIVECADCGTTVMWNEFPPAGLEGRSPAAAARAFDRWTRARFRLAAAGTCPSCAAEMGSPRLDFDPDGGEAIATSHRCENCRFAARIPLVGHVVDYPAVVTFYEDAGVDVVGAPYWELRRLARTFATDVVSEEPWRLSVTMDVDDGSLTLTLDERLDVTGVERSDG